MSEFPFPILFAAVSISILLSIVGVSLKKPALLAAAGLVGVPFTFYMGLIFDKPALILSLFQIVATFAVKRQKMLFAWLVIAPMIVFAASIVYIFLTQSLGPR